MADESAKPSGEMYELLKGARQGDPAAWATMQDHYGLRVSEGTWDVLREVLVDEVFHVCARQKDVPEDFSKLSMRLAEGVSDVVARHLLVSSQVGNEGAAVESAQPLEETTEPLAGTKSDLIPWAKVRNHYGLRVSDETQRIIGPILVDEVFNTLQARRQDIPGSIAEFEGLLDRAASDVVDWHLLVSLQVGNQSASNKLHALHKGWLKIAVEHFLGTDDKDVDDVFEKTWRKVMVTNPPSRRLDRPRDSVQAYMRKIAENECKDILGNRPPDPPPGSEPEADLPGPEGREPEQSSLRPLSLRPLLEGFTIIAGMPSCPHETIAYVLGRWLKRGSAEIVDKYSGKKLMEVVEELPAELQEGEYTHFRTARRWREVLSPLHRLLNKPVDVACSQAVKADKGKAAAYHGDPTIAAGDTRMVDYLPVDSYEKWEPRIRDWVENVGRRFHSAIDDQEEAVLRCTFSKVNPPHKSLAFGFLWWLRAPVGTYMVRCTEPLGSLASDLKAGLIADTELRKGLAPVRTEQALGELDDQLRSMMSLYVREPNRLGCCLKRGANLTAQTCNLDYFESTSDPVKQRAELGLWCIGVSKNLISCLEQTHSGFLFAWKKNLLRRLRQNEGREVRGHEEGLT